MLAIEADSNPNRTKSAILVSAIGPDTLERYAERSTEQPAQNNAAQANDNRNVLRSDVYADVVKRFELEFVWEKRVVFARYRFWIYERVEEQHFDDYTHLLMPANLKSTKT